MTLNDKQKTVLLRLLKTVVAGAIAAVIAWLASPDVANVIPTDAALYVIPIITSLLTAAEKSLRYGQDAGENKALSLFHKAPPAPVKAAAKPRAKKTPPKA